MSISKCPNCKQSMFRVEAVAPLDSEIVIRSVLCNTCNVVVGTLDEEKGMVEKLNIINDNLSKVMNGMEILNRKINDLRDNFPK